jgi:hypothetical protein
MQRSFEPMRKQVEAWHGSELTDVTAKVVIYEAFIEGELEAPKHLARSVMTSTSSRSMRNSGRERFGVFPMRLPPRSRNWIPFHNSSRRPSWVNSWRPGSHNRSSLWGDFRSVRPLNLEWQVLRGGLEVFPNSFAQAHFWTVTGSVKACCCDGE